MKATADLQVMLDALDEPALLIAGDRVLAANGAAMQLFGSAIRGSDVRLVIRQPRALEHILARTSGDAEVTGIAGAGRPWIVSVRPGPDGSLLVRLTDNSAMRAAEKMRVDFVANASHELRTPLAAILGYAETIADDGGTEPEVHARFGAIIRSEARRMLQIIEDLMSLSRIEADRFVPPRSLVAMDELVRLAIVNARGLADSRECELSADIEADLPEVPADRGQMLQVLDNLIGNALRYGCSSAPCRVTISARREDSTIVLAVADNGDGIPREHLPRLTERFYRVDAARSRDAGGTGLGLAIVKHIVERHRGALDIRSSVGVGTEVKVRLPIG